MVGFLLILLASVFFAFSAKLKTNLFRKLQGG